MAAKTPGDNAAKLRSQANPLTGEQPNSFTRVTNRELAKPVAAHEPAAFDRKTRATLRSAHVQATRTDIDPKTGRTGANAPQIGYGRPEGMAEGDFGRLMGAHRMFPNVAAQQGGPAINEPHELGSGVTAQRRAEDLSGPEYRKGATTLANYGLNARNPVGDLVRTQKQTTERVIGEHVAAGVEESASQHFYGGSPIQTKLPSADLQAMHDAPMRVVSGLMDTATSALENHPEYQRRTAGLSPEERHQGARNATVQATADTSPNSKFYEPSKGTSPNMKQATEVTTAAMEGRNAKFVSGRIQNNEKAQGRVGSMLPEHGQPNLDTHQFGDPTSAAKTVAFRGAFSEPNSPGAYKVTDVHEAGTILPGASTAKSKEYQGEGKKIAMYPDEPASKVKGLAPVMETMASGKTKHSAANSRAEQMLMDSKGTVHALNDYATREAASAYGISRGVNYADNLHPMQAAAWGSQQVHRGDVSTSHADQYPVVRDWASEGHSEMNDIGRATSIGSAQPSHMGPQFKVNPNTVRQDKSGAGKQDVSRNKPYPVMPGE